MIIALVFVAVLVLLCAFQVALALGAPWGRFAWGGQHPDVLPTGFRVASAVSVLVYAFLALVVLDLAGVLDPFPNSFSRVAMWVIAGVLALGVVMNAISRSKPERLVMTPVALALAVLALVIALRGPVPRTVEGMVLDDGGTVRFCTVVLESYPPQCGPDSPRVANWDWSGLDHEEHESIRCGTYRFTAVVDQSTMTVVTRPS
ncbi:hypothetical protein [Aestuariimicrobium sp. Y1814]|uniref:hypothetical protein n=1 Tax=Aestuariimicrobium sp. Y1814 TaxID=3418742 RepID=UPI003DA74D48